MAQTIKKQPPEVVGLWGTSGTTPVIITGPEGANQTYAIGAFLTWSNGLLIAATVQNQAIVGIAREAGHNLASGGIARYTPIGRQSSIKMNLLNANGADRVAVASDRGATYGWQVSAGVYYLDASVAGTFTITAIPGTDPRFDGDIGDTNIRVVCVP